MIYVIWNIGTKSHFSYVTSGPRVSGGRISRQAELHCDEPRDIDRYTDRGDEVILKNTPAQPGGVELSEVLERS